MRSVLSPERRQTVIAEALRSAGWERLPEAPDALCHFVDGALFGALSRHLDLTDAVEVVTQIRASLSLALRDLEPEPTSTSEVRVSRRLPDAPLRVLVATRASLVVFLLQDVLGDDVEVMPVSSAAQLDDLLERCAGGAVVVVDRKHACLDESVCPKLARALDEQSTVIWWGAPADELHRVEQHLTVLGGPAQVGCEEAIPLVDVANLCRVILS